MRRPRWAARCMCTARRHVASSLRATHPTLRGKLSSALCHYVMQCSIDDMKRIMRYNDFRHDALSSQMPTCKCVSVLPCLV